MTTATLTEYVRLLDAAIVLSSAMVIAETKGADFHLIETEWQNLSNEIMLQTAKD